MFKFQLFGLLKWIHVGAMALGGGAALVALLLSGFEDQREDLRGLAATVWKRTSGWAFRVAVLMGLVLLFHQVRMGGHPLDARYLHLKLVFAAALLVFSELSPKALAVGKRGAATLAFLLFLLTTFVTVNGMAFGYLHRPAPELSSRL